MTVTRHSIYNLSGAIAPLAVLLVTTPLYIAAIGLERYGILAIFWTLVSSLGFLSLGMGPAVAQRLASAVDLPPADRSRIVWTAAFLSLAAGCAGIVAVVGAGQFYFGGLARTAAGLQAEIRDALPWLAAGFPLVMLQSVFAGALQGTQRFKQLNSIQVANVTLAALVPLSLAYLVGPALDMLVAGWLAVNSCALVAQILAARAAVPLARPAQLDRATVRGLAAFGGWVTISGMLGPILVLVDRFVIGALLGAASVALYVVPFSLVNQLALFPAAVAAAIFPRLAALGPKEARAMSSDLLRVMAFLLTPMMLVALVALDPVLRLWIGEAAARRSTPVGYILLLGIWANGLARIPFSRLQAGGRPDLVAKIHAGELLPYALLLYVATLNFGLVGAAFAWTARTIADAIALTLMDRVSGAIMRLLAQHLALLSAATAVMYFLPASPGRWLLFGGVLVAVALLVATTVPPQIKEFILRNRPRGIG